MIEIYRNEILTIKSWRTPQNLLLAMMFVMPFTFSVWQVLLNNFVIEKAAFTGSDIGLLQSIREVPGFLAFTAVFVLLLLKEQIFALISLLLMSIGIALTGYFPSIIGLASTTLLMSTGFHYFETINKSLTLQWLDKSETAHFLGRSLAVKSFASLSAYSIIWLLMEQMDMSYQWMYILAGGTGILVVLFIWIGFPQFPPKTAQHKHLVFRKSYWLYYLLTFLSGARRQIFMVFAGFMMVEKFGYSVSQISLLFMINYIFNLFFGAAIGRWIGRIGDRNALLIEYSGLFLVFLGYAFVENGFMAATLYIIDHLFFALSMAINTYFQKIANKKDIASTASVSFTINHIAAVVIPVILGYIWLNSPTLVFLIGSGIAVLSWILAFNIPRNPEPGNEVMFGFKKSDILKNTI